MSRLLCWWFGCDPDYSKVSRELVIPCKRCGATDTSYGDRVGDTRQHRMADGLLRIAILFRPPKCNDCGKRFGNHDDCDNLPF